MSTSKKAKEKKSKPRDTKNRNPKILGLVFVLIAFFLFIAFTSYLFTWHIDQSNVFSPSWNLLFNPNVEAANLLGRFGAIISNVFFYWGIGLSSFVIVYLFGWVGFHLLKDKKPKRPLRVLKNSFLIILFSCIYLEFIFANSSFPWGGAFGQGACTWLQSFLGTIGMVVLLLFVLIGMVIWYFNPDLSQVSMGSVVGQMKTFSTDVAQSDNKATAIKDKLSDAVNAAKAKREEILKNIQHQEEREAAESIDEEENEILQELELNPQPEPEKIIVKSDVPEKQLTLELLDEEAERANDNEQPQLEDVKQGGHLGLDTQFDPRLDLGKYQFPSIELLHDYSEQKVEVDRAELEANKDQIIATLQEYKIEITKIRATVGPTVTLYEIIPAPGVRISKIKSLEDDIALKLAALGIRIIAPIPGKGTIGIEVPNKKRQVVSLKEILQSEKFTKTKMDLPIALGKTIANEVFIADLAKMPHLLIAGATGQGKSVGINALLISILYKKHPTEVKLVLIDPKKVELFPYAKLENHFLGFLPDQVEPIVTETKKVIHTLNSLCIEMDQRYDLLKKAEVRNIKEYNTKFLDRHLNPEKGHKFLPFIILVIDEFADLIMTAGKEVELPIGRLAQLARAVGIHLIIATQRPSVNIITGVIKANFPARLAFKVSSKFDSRTILDSGGADQLVGQGDMLLSVGGDTIRLQCAFVDTPEVEKVIQSISSQKGFPIPYYLPEYQDEDNEMHGVSGLKYGDLDDMFEDAAKLVVINQHGSTSMIQRRLKLGYNRAGRIMDQLESLGIVGAGDGSKPREVLIMDEVELDKYLDELKTKA